MADLRIRARVNAITHGQLAKGPVKADPAAGIEAAPGEEIVLSEVDAKLAIESGNFELVGPVDRAAERTAEEDKVAKVAADKVAADKLAADRAAAESDKANPKAQKI